MLFRTKGNRLKSLRLMAAAIIFTCGLTVGKTWAVCSEPDPTGCTYSGATCPSACSSPEKCMVATWQCLMGGQPYYWDSMGCCQCGDLEG